MLLGRSFTERDGKSSPKVAIVNRTLARRYFGDADPLGRRFGVGNTEALLSSALCPTANTRIVREQTPDWSISRLRRSSTW